MRLVRLEVDTFKCVERAELELGPGLNVLYGPNDLGKTSLLDAVRAVLLLQSTSSEAKEYAPWGSAHVPRVRLQFEHREQHWRVEKRFAEGTRTYALLEHSKDGAVWSKAEERRAVDAELRKMLGWGVREPGGKGAPKGLPSSFLTTALFGRASDLEAVFAADLGKDLDPAGRNRLAEALQTFAEDPLFKRMLTRAQQHLDAVKRADGSFSTKRDSPMVKIGERIKQLESEHEQLMRALQESEAIEAAVRGHLDRRAELTDALELARQRLGELEALHVAGARTREAAERAQRARARVDEADALFARRTELDASARALRLAIAEAERGVAVADQQLQAATVREREAEAALARASEDATAPARAREQALGQRRAELGTQHERAAAKRQKVIGALALQSEAQASERVADDAQAALRRREAAHAERGRALADAEARAHALELAVAWWAWREASDAALRYERDVAEASSLRAQARLRRAAAERELATLQADPLPDRALLELLRGLEAELQLAEHKAAVGFAVRLQLDDAKGVTLAVDGAPARALGKTREQGAERELVIELPGRGSIAIVAGSAALRAELEAARTRWHDDAMPVLSRHGLADTTALAQRIGERETKQSALEGELREVALLEREADRLDVDAERLAAARARREQADAALGDVDRAALERTASQQDAAESQRAHAELLRELDGARAQAQQEATALAVERAKTEHARGDATAARTRADAALAGLAGDLGALRAELDDELAACTAELATIDRELASTRASSEQALAQARAALDEAGAAVTRERIARGRAEGEAARLREQLAAASALLADADQRAAAIDRDAIVADAERLAAELAALPQPERTVDASELAAARDAVTAKESELAAATDELRKAEGRLDQLRGTGSPRALERAREAIEVAGASEAELRRDVDGWQLLRDTLRAVETEQGQHLGVALGGAIEQRLRRLTEGRYGRLELDRDLRTSGLRAAGEPRAIELLSEGLKEQLATLVRLAIAEHLRTMVLLDDHLAQTDPQRVEWFRDLLREVGGKVQIVVLTCRPRDYLDERELADGTPVFDSADGRVRAIDLARIVRRA